MTNFAWMKTGKSIILASMAALLASACDNGDSMMLSYQHTVQVGVYSRYTKNDTTLTNVKVYGVGRSDSLLYDVESVGELFLNLNMNADETSFVIKTQTIQDELSFTYSKELTPVDGGAGITMEMRLDSVWSNAVFIDSVAISHSAIKYNESLENVKIFIY